AELGPIDSGFLAKGVHIHTSLVLNTNGVVIGIGAQQIWTRPPQSAGLKPEKEDEARESHKWIMGIEQVDESLWEAIHRNGMTTPPRQIHIADREADTYEALQTLDDMGQSGVIRSVQLRDAARSEPQAPATRILTEEECRILQLKYSKHADPFRVPLTIGQAVLWIGRLGGHQNRKGDGMPGVRTLWRGLHDLNILVEGYRVGAATKKLRIPREIPRKKENGKG
ncbi:MAG: hypothetical protein EXS05_03075, partial [Planctomycetaceae bacterium]|nr:hypothetical protein [Planctomycetaceae bacterium]